MRRISAVITLVVLISTALSVAPNAAHAAPNYSTVGGVDHSGRKAVQTEAHDKQRAPGYSGQVNTSPRKTNTCVPDADGLCEVKPEASPCIDENEAGQSYLDIQERVDRENANRGPNDRAISVYCGGTVPYFQERTVAYNPQDEINIANWVRDYFNSTALPVPKPEISAKNGGICGVIHTLDLHMPVELRHQEMNTPFGPLELHLYGKIEINWGDGETTHHTTAGGPYPSSIGHSWTTRGHYNITANAHWRADYSLGPYNGYIHSGTLSGITTTGSIDNFRIFEAQAILVK